MPEGDYMAEKEQTSSKDSDNGNSNHKDTLATRAARFFHLRRVHSLETSRDRASSNSTGKISEKSRAETNGTSTHANGSSLAKQKQKALSEKDIEAENLDRRRNVRTLPPWIHSVEQGESLSPLISDTQPIRDPPRIKPPHHNHMPDPKHEPRLQAARGRVWDHARSGEAVIMSVPAEDYESRWKSFAEVSAYPKRERSRVVDEEWRRNNLPDLDEPYSPPRDSEDMDIDERMWLFSNQKRTATQEHIQRVLMKNPFIPLIIRLIVMAFCLAGLALGVQIYRTSKRIASDAAAGNVSHKLVNADGDYICKQQTSTYMAFIIDAVAVVYLTYITYDEYFSKPLGLRSSKDKMRLLFLDLFFIIFSAANLSLAFSTLTDRQWSCYDANAAARYEDARSTCIQNETLCRRQKGLVSVLLLVEIAWVLTFAISVLRVVERISR